MILSKIFGKIVGILKRRLQECFSQDSRSLHGLPMTNSPSQYISQRRRGAKPVEIFAAFAAQVAASAGAVSLSLLLSSAASKQ